uniref:Uncharacterized protein n=1 Tax=Bionectria ochroleuca TaxID=29856 RepID=A0A8H7KCV4_BIOOC
MKFNSIVAALTFATGIQGWTKYDQKIGLPITIVGLHEAVTNVHESCTRMNDNTVIYCNNEACAYWTDCAGTIKRGRCKLTNQNPSTASCV